MTLTENVRAAFLKLVDLQNDPIGITARDSAWHQKHEAGLADAQEAVMAALRKLVPSKADAS